MFRPAGALREAALWIAAAIGTLCLVTAIAAVAFGMTPLIFRSGSMSPGIPTGSLAIALSTPASELAVGDIVSVVWSDGLRVTHRLVAIEPGGGSIFLLSTKGDANASPDHERVAASTADRVIWSAPGLGYLFEEATKPQWVFGLGVVVGVLLLLAFRGATHSRARGRARRSHRQSPRNAAARVGTVGVASVVGLAIAVSTLVASPTGTLASFNDPAAAVTSFSATTVQPPTAPGCVVTGGALSAKTVTLSWTAPTTGAPPTSYLVAWSGVGTPGSATVSAPATSYAISPGILGVGIYTFTITSQYGTTPWVSSSSISQQITWVTSLVVTGC